MNSLGTVRAPMRDGAAPDRALRADLPSAGLTSRMLGPIRSEHCDAVVARTVDVELACALVRR